MHGLPRLSYVSSARHLFQFTGKTPCSEIRAARLSWILCEEYCGRLVRDQAGVSADPALQISD